MIRILKLKMHLLIHCRIGYLLIHEKALNLQLGHMKLGVCGERIGWKPLQILAFQSPAYAQTWSTTQIFVNGIIGWHYFVLFRLFRKRKYGNDII